MAAPAVPVPAGAAHKFANAGEEPVRARVEVRPALAPLGWLARKPLPLPAAA
jgi:hypothetical protein